MRVVVIDSGLDIGCKLAKDMMFHGGIEIYEDEYGNCKIRDNAVDDMGHGTAVASLIHKLLPEVEIIPIKIMRDNKMASYNTLYSALEYVYDCIECDVINISAGIICCKSILKLQSLCEKLTKKNVVIVAAYDNGGAVSYPAYFDNVIGVDGKRNNLKWNQIIKVAGRNADYIGKLKENRLPSLNGKMEICAGNSFLTPVFIKKIIDIREKGNITFSSIIKELDSSAVRTASFLKYVNDEITFPIRKAIVFPFNKEMHSLARFEEMLSFSIENFYDIKYSTNIGKSIRGQINSNSTKIIQDIDVLDWEEPFDTVILGHTSVLSEAVNINYEKYIIDKCIEHHKQLFSCHDIRQYHDILKGINYYCPKIDEYAMAEFIKMHVIGRPILGIVGTGSSQGKFTLQLGLRQSLLRKGYKVAQLGTEPTAQLFGMDCVYPMGHESSVYIKGFSAVLKLNQMMGYLESKNPDLIMFGNQANTVPVRVGGPQDYPVVQHELILGCQADAYILCISSDAPMDYIKRTIAYLENIYVSKVLAIVISPFTIGYRWSNISGAYKYMEQDEMDELTLKLTESFEIPVFSMKDSMVYDKLSEEVVYYFAEG